MTKKKLKGLAMAMKKMSMTATQKIAELADAVLEALEGELVHPVTNVSGTAAVTTTDHFYSVKWTGHCEGVTALRDGMMVNIKIPVQGNSTYHTVLDINGLGEHPVCRNVTSEASAYTAESIVTLIYDANAQAEAFFDSGTATTVTGVWKIGDYDSTNIYHLRHGDAYGTYVALTDLPARVLCLQKNETTLIPVNATGETRTSKVLTTESFNPFGAIVYVSASYDANAAIASAKIYEQFNADFRISFNTGTNLTANKDVYICAVPQSDGMAKLDATTPIVQELPSTDDGKIYIYLGHASSNRNVEIYPVHPVYWFKGGKVVPYTVLDISAKADKSYVDEKFLSKCIDITYSALKALRDNSQLVPGQWYRITDYVTTTAQADTRSTGHQFDVIVMADSVNTLNEDAHAALHSGDTYFASCKLSAWQIKYCLDNDTTRFAWADSTNGKGVIYRMVDERNNDCPYDFKNIQFKRWPMTGQVVISEANYADDLMVARCARMTELIGTSVTKDTYSIRLGFMGDNPVLGSTLSDNYVDAEGTAAVIDTEAYYLPLNIPQQTGKILYCKVGEPVYLYTFDLKGNESGSDISLIDTNIYSNSIAEYYNNGVQTLNNVIFAVYEVLSNYEICYNKLIMSYNNIFGQYIRRNNFCCEIGNSIFSYQLTNNFAGGRFVNVIAGYKFESNSFEGVFGLNIFGDQFRNNRVGSQSIRNVFGASFMTNQVQCIQNSIIGDSFQYNIIGSNTLYLKFGNDVTRCIFENDCQRITMDVDHVKYVKCEQSLRYINIVCSETTSSALPMMRHIFKSGISGSSNSERRTINVDTVDNGYPIIIQRADTKIINV